MALSIIFTQSPPILVCTPYQMLILNLNIMDKGIKGDTHHAIALRLNVHQSPPNTPKLVRITTGKGMWNTAPCRAFSATNSPTTACPIQTQIHACHHDRPSCIIDEAIIHLCDKNEMKMRPSWQFITHMLRLKESEIQLTKKLYSVWRILCQLLHSLKYKISPRPSTILGRHRNQVFVLIRYFEFRYAQMKRIHTDKNCWLYVRPGALFTSSLFSISIDKAA